MICASRPTAHVKTRPTAHIKTRHRPKLYVILLRKKSPRVWKKSNYHCIRVGDEEDGKDEDEEEEEEEGKGQEYIGLSVILKAPFSSAVYNTSITFPV